jgi:hypothetical protein
VECITAETLSKGEAWEVVYQHGHKDQRVTLLRKVDHEHQIVIQVFRHEIPTEHIANPTGRILRVRAESQAVTTWEDIIDSRKRFYGYKKGKEPKVVYRNSKRAKQE